MKKQLHLFLITLNTLIGTSIAGQDKYDLGFVKSNDTVTRSKTQNLILQYLVTAKNTDKSAFKEYSLYVDIDDKSSSLANTEFLIPKRAIRFGDLTEDNSFFIIIKKDSISDRDRTLNLVIKVKKANGDFDDIATNTSTATKLNIVVKGVETESLNKDYSYLGYLGTNFDLVDGIKAKNLFFAMNTFVPPTPKGNKVGLYLSLYGNRTMTTSDSTSNVIRTSKLVRISDTSYWRYTEQSNLTLSRVSDNLGAYMNPLIRLWKASSENNSIKLYYSPSLEFVWRRTESTYKYSEGKNQDSTKSIGLGVNSIEYSRTSTQYSNEFSFNVGLLGVFIAHENKYVSMRVHMSVGYSSNYLPQRPNTLRTDVTSRFTKQHDVFFSGRAWITEGITGLTLQAEITNTWKYPRPFYGVTLSKAINFKNLSTIFQPITSR